MNSVTIITHFSQPNWPMVNKLSAICKCLDVKMVHCSSLEKLKEALNSPPSGHNLFFTDEGMIDLVQEFDARPASSEFEVAMFISSTISKVAQRVSEMKIVKYLIGTQPTEAHGRDLSILIKKFANGDILDLNKYLAFGCNIRERKISSSKSKRDAIDAVVNYISGLGDPGYNHPFHEYARRVAELTDELLLNAVFDANPRLRGADRSKPFALEPQEQIEMAWGYDGEYFGISVRDPFGKFTCETIMKYLSAQRSAEDVITSKSGGLGLRFIFEKAHQVVTNVKKEQVTEVIVMVKFVNRMLDFENQKKSFYFFGDSDSKLKKTI